MIKIIINIDVHFVGYLYFLDLINARQWNMLKLQVTIYGLMTEI